MAVKYYDDIITAKLMKWIPEGSRKKLRVLKPDETKRLFEMQAADTNDAPFTLPCVSLSRSNDIELLLNIKNPRSYDGVKLEVTPESTKLLNQIPIKLQYQLDIYAKTVAEADEYVRHYLFKLINNPTVKITVPYNEKEPGKGGFTHTANMRVLNSIADTSAISERLFSGQFTRWTINIELQDAFLFSIPYKNNWQLFIDDETVVDPSFMSVLEVANDFNSEPVETSYFPMYFKKVQS